jgi:hypothetical protein
VRVPSAEEERIYLNRRNYHSINVQVNCEIRVKIVNIRAKLSRGANTHFLQVTVDAFGNFTNAVAKYPGSVHDAYILRQSALYDAFENNRLKGALLADAGYPNKPWLKTPIAHPQTDVENE